MKKDSQIAAIRSQPRFLFRPERRGFLAARRRAKSTPAVTAAGIAGQGNESLYRHFSFPLLSSSFGLTPAPLSVTHCNATMTNTPHVRPKNMGAVEQVVMDFI